MQLNEPNALLRRIEFAIHDVDGVLIEDDSALTGVAAGDVQTSANGAAFANAPGTFGYAADGLYYYEATLAEAGVPGFLAVKFERAGFRTELAWEPVGPIFTLGEDDPVLLRLPLVIYNDPDGELAEGADVDSPEQLQTSLNAADFANAAGTLVEVSDGLYYYQAVAGDAAASVDLAVKFTKAGYRTTIETIEVEEPATASDTDAPTIVAISPTPGIAPGQPGGFPADPDLARVTPIIIELADANGLAYIGVFARFGGSDGPRTPIFRRGAYEAGYSIFSSIEIVDEETTRLHVLADAGWQTTEIEFVVDAVDNGGNVS
jgi:hypothetical protein